MIFYSGSVETIQDIPVMDYIILKNLKFICVSGQKNAYFTLFTTPFYLKKTPFIYIPLCYAWLRGGQSPIPTVTG